MEQDLVSAEIPAEDIAVINTAIATLKEKLPFLISLSPQEKASLFKVGENYKPFIQKAMQAVYAHPEIMPGMFNIREFSKDYSLFTSLEPIKSRLLELVNALDSTETAAGSDALIASLDIYNAVKENMNKVPGLKTIYDEMKVHFPRKRTTQIPAETTTH